MKARVLIALTLCLAVMTPVGASNQAASPAEQLAMAIADIRVGLEPGGKYAYVPKIDRRDIEDQLNTMTSLLQGVARIEDMNQRRRIRLFNAQERLNGLLLQAEGDRSICESHKVTGSHMTSTVCMTRAEKESAKGDTERTWLNYNKGAPGPRG